MKAHSVAPTANYVNWMGRTVQQVNEEEMLWQALEKFFEETRLHCAECRRGRFARQ